MAKALYWHTQKVVHFCEMFGKYYFFLEDVDGHLYGVKAKEATGQEWMTNREVASKYGMVPDLT